jgi:phosphatidylglycerophosphate synthase
VQVRPHLVGKVATVLQMACVLWILLKWDSGAGERWLFWCCVVASVCTGISGGFYVWDGVRQLSASPSSSAVKRE